MDLPIPDYPDVEPSDPSYIYDVLVLDDSKKNTAKIIRYDGKKGKKGKTKRVK